MLLNEVLTPAEWNWISGFSPLRNTPGDSEQRSYLNFSTATSSSTAIPSTTTILNKERQHYHLANPDPRSCHSLRATPIARPQLHRSRPHVLDFARPPEIHSTARGERDWHDDRHMYIVP